MSKQGLITVGLLLLATVSSSLSAYAETDVFPLSEKLETLGKPLIVNGNTADPNEYPASFQAGDSVDDMCTWFLINSQTLVGAAHCVKSADRTVTIVANGARYSGKCATPLDYLEDASISYPDACRQSIYDPNDQSQDWALCLLAKPYDVPRSPTIPISGFEVLNADPKRLVENQRIEISGFGCTDPKGAVTDKYQIGTSVIAVLPPRAHIPNVTGRTSNAIEVRQAPALLCNGDSGGPAFLLPSTDQAIRVVIGTNLKTALDSGQSFLASTSTNDALKYFRCWADGHKQRLCGLHADAKGCRPTAP
ncbi:S1 family peptidase [Caballeronia sp. ATUFL_M2_KS44]|uniref:S1 family peptidase n=1 Tax=Caballeronia sp. ATUFL_M2_KS44 TaxID=2921767 RepID=UPI0020292F84|nr:S1 family peptidase [Caballeronia sp. ATUFL_M2_KS44]